MVNFKRVQKVNLGNYRLASLTFIPGKIMEWVFLKPRKQKVMGSSQHGFTKGILCLTNFYGKMIGYVDKERGVHVQYPDFSNVFDVLSHNIPVDKLGYYSGWVNNQMSKNIFWWLNPDGNGLYSTNMLLTRAAPQESILGPVTFKVFNKLEEVMGAFSSSLQITSNWGDQLICLRAGLPFRQPREAGGTEQICGKGSGVVVGTHVTVCPGSSRAIWTGAHPTDQGRDCLPH